MLTAPENDRFIPISPYPTFTGSLHLCHVAKATCKLLAPICWVMIHPSLGSSTQRCPGSRPMGTQILPQAMLGAVSHAGSCQAAALLQPASSLCWKLPARCAAWLSPTACPPQGRQGCQDRELLTGENFIISLQHLPGFVYIGPLYIFALFSACLLQSSILLK